MTMGENESTERGGGKYAERFTPARVVFEMLLQPHFIDEGKPLRKLDSKIFDECCGQGQFSCAIVVLKIFYNCLELPPDERARSVLKILSGVYGMDIQEKSCEKAKEHLFWTVMEAYEWFFGVPFPLIAEAALMIDNAIQCGNVLEFLAENTPLENRDARYYENIKYEAKRGYISQEFADRILKSKNKQQTLF